MYLVTGGAGFIGSNIVAQLARRGEHVVVCDWFGTNDKWKNIAKYRVHDVIAPEQLGGWLAQHSNLIQGIIHMGAISATTERDVDLIVRSNFQLSLDLWTRCAEHQWPFIYASSAATYGDGANGFDDKFEPDALDRLRPLNPYGWSKHVFDRRVCRTVSDGDRAPPKWAGLKFFNVYGANEYHKGSMRSLIATNYERIASGEPLRLFRSCRADYQDGGQKRDFVYVADCVSIVLWMLDNPFPSSVYNVGSGQARSWLDLGRTFFQSAKLPEYIEYIDMPEGLRSSYQYFTEAPMEKLRSAGYRPPMTSLEDGVRDYVTRYLSSEDRYA